MGVYSINWKENFVFYVTRGKRVGDVDNSLGITMDYSLVKLKIQTGYKWGDIR